MSMSHKQYFGPCSAQKVSILGNFPKGKKFTQDDIATIMACSAMQTKIKSACHSIHMKGKDPNESPTHSPADAHHMRRLSLLPQWKFEDPKSKRPEWMNFLPAQHKFEHMAKTHDLGILFNDDSFIVNLLMLDIFGVAAYFISGTKSRGGQENAALLPKDPFAIAHIGTVDLGANIVSLSTQQANLGVEYTATKRFTRTNFNLGLGFVMQTKAVRKVNSTYTYQRGPIKLTGDLGVSTNSSPSWSPSVVIESNEWLKPKLSLSTEFEKQFTKGSLSFSMQPFQQNVLPPIRTGIDVTYANPHGGSPRLNDLSVMLKVSIDTPK